MKESSKSCLNQYFIYIYIYNVSCHTFQKYFISTTREYTSLKVISPHQISDSSSVWDLDHSIWMLNVSLSSFPWIMGSWCRGCGCVHLDSVCPVSHFPKETHFSILRSADIFDIWGFSQKSLLWCISRTGNPPKLLNYTPGTRREPFQIHFNMKSTAMNDFSARPIITYQYFYLIIIIIFHQ